MAQEQTMKPETAARKLGVLLSATPDAFRAEPVSRSALQALQDEPPAWLVDLRRDGPHPREVVAARLGVSVSGLRRAEVTEPLTSEQIRALLAERPEWLVREREVHAGVMAENARSSGSGPSSRPDPRLSARGTGAPPRGRGRGRSSGGSPGS